MTAGFGGQGKENRIGKDLNINEKQLIVSLFNLLYNTIGIYDTNNHLIKKNIYDTKYHILH